MAVDPLAQRISTFAAEMRRLLDELEAAPILQPLTLDTAIGRVGQLLSIAIGGAVDGSTIAGIPPDGMTLDSAARTMAGTPTQEGTFAVILTETLAGARNSPHSTNLSITIQPAIIPPPPPESVTMGNSRVRMGDRRIRMNGVGTGPVVVQNFAFGPPGGQTGENGTAIQNFAFGPATGQAGEGGSSAVQNFAFGPATAQAGEGPITVQNFAFGSTTTTPSE